MKKLMILACCLGLLSGMATAAEVYKWKDGDGRVRYTDLPPPGNIPVEKVLAGGKVSKPATTAAPAEAGKPAVAGKEPDAKKRKDSDNAKQAELEKLEQQKVREENCAAAKSNLQNFKQGGRIYKIDEKGERHYLDDNDIAAGMDKANKDIEQWCN